MRVCICLTSQPQAKCYKFQAEYSWFKFTFPSILDPFCEAKEPNLPNYLLIADGQITNEVILSNGINTTKLTLTEAQTASFRILIWVVQTLSNDDARNAKRAAMFVSMYVCMYILRYVQILLSLNQHASRRNIAMDESFL